MAKKSNHAVVQSLSKLLADTYVVALKTQNYHWNVTGPQFNSLHAMFMAQYMELHLAVDEVAERIRALDEFTPGSFSAFGKLSSVKEETGNPNAAQMVKNLANDHDTLADSAQGVVKAAQEIGDEASADLGIKRMQIHQKTAWMLRAQAA
jgi:starvation-inducible DNA-binding protein